MFWRTPLFPARPLVCPSSSLRTVCVLDLSEQMDCPSNIPSDFMYERPAHHTQGDNDRFLSFVLLEMVGVDTYNCASMD